jgi:glycosyltransferase involved in cell wall biosynthesis
MLKVKRPTISLCLIAKNEEKNINRLLESVDGCFDEVILVDTGSTDRTKDLAKSGGCKIFDFQWVNDFSKARNFAFSKATSDFVMWLDLDDVLVGKDKFILWRDHAMEFADCFLATYNYAVNKDGTPIISFARERVFRRSIEPMWQYPIHEGIILNPEWRMDYAVTWSVNHLRDAEDIKADKSRNLNVFESFKENGSLNGRMQFYYAKELYEANRPFEAITAFESALKKDLEHHDRMLSHQYAAYSAMACGDKLAPELVEEKNGYYRKAIEFSHLGLALSPNRAELQVACGDANLKLGNLIDAIPYYAASKQCVNAKTFGQTPYEGAIYSFVDCYGLAPSLNLAKVYFHLGRIDESREEAEYAVRKFNSDEAKKLIQEIDRIKAITAIDNNQADVPDIVFTTPPQNAYEFDEEKFKTMAMGGSETALIQVAAWLKKKTGRPVKVFNMRKDDLTAESGVEYISNTKVNQYLSQNKPAIHIAWRHNIKMTNAKTYLWCHDLITPTVESEHNFHKIMCLTTFHKNYVMAKQGVPNEKIMVTRNGIDPKKFDFERPLKNPNKLVWMSSHDRGLDKAMLVCDEVIKDFPALKLHVFNSLHGLYRGGLGALADKLKAMMNERPYVIFHGFTEQEKMYRMAADAAIWCHPCNFIETYCITALEMLELGIYPVTRRLGGLQNTLASAEEMGMATMLDHGCETKDELDAYVREVKSALAEKKWENIKFDRNSFSWESLADDWIKEFGL